MKFSSHLLLAVLLTLAVTATATFAATSTPDRYINEGNALLAAAKAETKNLVRRDELLKDAVKNYNRVLKEYPKSIEAAEALLKIGEAQEQMGITPKDINKNQYAAVQTYKRLETQYGSYERLKRLYGPEDAARVQRVVEEATARYNRLAAEIDKRNSKNPLYKLLDFLVSITHRKPAISYWLAIVILTVAVKILITPLTKAQFKSMREMQRIQPLVKELQEKYKGNQRELGEKVMALYKEHGINPLAGCLPLLLQFPIMYFLYYTIRLYEFQFAHGHFLWITPALGHRFPQWVASSLAQPDIPLVVLYTISMIVSMRLSNVDPTQEQQQKMMSIYMPILFAFLFRSFPSAFLLYWLVFNVLSTVQQYYILRGGQEPQTALVGGTGSRGRVGGAEEGAARSDEERGEQAVATRPADKPQTAPARPSGGSPRGGRPRSRRRRR